MGGRRAFDPVAAFDARRPLAAALAIAFAALMVYGASRTRFDTNVRNLFRSDEGRMEVMETLYEQFGTDDYNCLVILSAEDVLAPEPLAVLRALARRLRGLPAVGTVLSVDDAVDVCGAGLPRPMLPGPGSPPDAFARARERALAHPLTGGRLVSGDGRHALVMVGLRPEIDYLDYFRDPSNPIRDAIDASVQATAVRATLTGIPVIRAELLHTMQREQVRFLLLGAVAGAVVCLLLFRALAPVLLATVAAGLGAVSVIGVMGLVAEPINPVNSVIPTLVLVIGYTDAVHMIYAVRASVGEGRSPRDATVDALRLVGPACVLTSLTTAIGFGSLAAARLDVIERFGVTAAAGAGLSLLAVLAVVPLLGGAMPARWLAPGARRGGSGGGAGGAGGTRPMRFLERARLVSFLGLALTVALAVACTRLQASAWLREGTPRGSTTGAAVDLVDEAFGGLLSLIVLVEWDETLEAGDPALGAALAEVHALLEARPLFGRPLSILSLLEVLPQAGGPPAGAPPWSRLDRLGVLPAEITARLHRPDLRRTIVVAPTPDNGTHRQMPVLASLERALHELDERWPGIAFGLSGNPIAVGRSAAFMIEDLAVSLALAAGVIFLVMSIAFRSLALGVLSVVPNVFPLVTAGAALVAAGHPLTITGVICFCVCLGIAVDDTIHVVVRTRHERRAGVPVRVAVERALRAVAPALITTTAVLLAGFATVLFSRMPMLGLFGALCCVALLAALGGDLVILPALLVAFWRGPGDR